MPKRSLFSLLSEQPWWVSVLAAMGVFAIAQLIFPPLAPFVAVPFVAIAIYFAWRQMRALSPDTVGARLAALRAMSWEDFSTLVAEAYRRRGYEVDRARGGAFDFTLRRNGRITLVQCRRWKVRQVGIGPLRELYEAVDGNNAFNAVCIAAGNFSDTARQFASGKPITLLNGAELARLVGKVKTAAPP